jgi:hypothetical protein
MVFFVVYTAYEGIYRKTAIFLILFMSFFILSQYYFSPHWEYDVDNERRMSGLHWLGIYNSDDRSDPFNNKDAKSFYFRLKPEIFDWFILFAMSILNSVNQMYSYKKDVMKITKKCENSLKDNFKGTTQFFSTL